MYASIQKWGNSQGLRLPKVLLEGLGLRENDRVELIQTADVLTIKKVLTAPHRSLEERLTDFYGKPIEEIQRRETREEDWGEPEGGERW